MTLNRNLTAAQTIVRALPDSSDKEVLKYILDSMTDRLFKINSDLETANDKIAELSKKIYEPVVIAQAGDACKYIDADALSKGAYTYEEFRKMLQQACESDAKVLGAFLRKYLCPPTKVKKPSRLCVRKRKAVQELLKELGKPSHFTGVIPYHGFKIRIQRPKSFTWELNNQIDDPQIAYYKAMSKQYDELEQPCAQSPMKKISHITFLVTEKR